MELMKMIPAALVVLLVGSTMAYAFNGNEFSISKKELDEGQLKEMVPESYDKALELVEPPDAVAKPNRFILWTNDGQNVMWGKYGNGFFVGEDNTGKKAWGVYHKGIFMGFYDGKEFKGEYGGPRLKRFFWWRADGLFGLKDGKGGILTFPRMGTMTADIGMEPQGLAKKIERQTPIAEKFSAKLQKRAGKTGE
ncbi:hypothetical protein A3K63_03155 [Candidatus Micrarchaeota archaeon RBG_16_49_10]|nr:MAG: hypothetical protein A3K63_03155 [Candidatus Micrarchaeota archaeon RBG_16_49_10]